MPQLKQPFVVARSPARPTGHGARVAPLARTAGDEATTMTRTPIATALAAALALASIAGRQKQEAPTAPAPSTTGTAPAPATTTAVAAKAAPTDYNQLADRLVANAAVKEGDVVLVSGRASDAELLEDIAVAVRKVGAFPMVEHESDRLSKRLTKLSFLVDRTLAGARERGVERPLAHP